MSRRGPKRARGKGRVRSRGALTESSPPETPTMRVTLGGADISALVMNLQVRRAVGELGRATFSLAPEPLAELRLDWQGEVIIDAVANQQHIRMFTGAVTDALPVSLSAHSGVAGVTAMYAVRCATGTALSESNTGVVAHSGLGAADLIHILLRGVGWTPDRMSIEGDDDLPTEVFEVYSDVRDVNYLAATRISGVHLIRGSSVTRLLAEQLPEHDLREQLLKTELFALTLVDAHLVQDALEVGVQRIDETLAWLATRVQDGTTLRAGHYWPYLRHQTLAHPRRGNVTLARGLMTGRLLLRGAAGTTQPQAIDVRQGALVLAPPMPASLPPADRLAVLAWNRAREDGVFGQRVQALWDCLEFYASSTHVPRIFDDSQLGAARAAMKEIVSGETQQARLIEMIGRLNDPPLMVKIVEAARIDGVELSDIERQLLARLRRTRNRASHGSAPQQGRDEDLRHGLSVAARLLAGRASRRAGYSYN
jgi:hypothetical protein